MKRQAVAHFRASYEVPAAGCLVIGADRKSMRGFGYRRLQILLQRKGSRMSNKKFRWLYREARLQVHCRGGRKGALGRST